MKRLVAIVLVATLSTGGCAVPLSTRGPKIVHGAWLWDNVVSLPPDALVRVFTTGALYEGTIVAADDVGLQIFTKHGALVLPVDLVLRVDRLAVLSRRSRGERALRSAAGGTAAFVGSSVVVAAFFCAVMSGRPCWIPPSPGAIAATAAIFGGLGALSDDGREMTIYVRP